MQLLKVKGILVEPELKMKFRWWVELADFCTPLMYIFLSADDWHRKMKHLHSAFQKRWPPGTQIVERCGCPIKRKRIWVWFGQLKDGTWELEKSSSSELSMMVNTWTWGFSNFWTAYEPKVEGRLCMYYLTKYCHMYLFCGALINKPPSPGTKFCHLAPTVLYQWVRTLPCQGTDLTNWAKYQGYLYSVAV